MGWYIALGIILFLAWLPLGVWVRYENKVVTLKVLAWCFQIPILPGKKKDQKKPKKKKKPKKTVEKKAKEESQPKEKKKFRITLDAILDALDILRAFVVGIGHRLHMKRLEVALVYGGTSPAKTAIDYGKGCAILASVESLIDQVFHVKHRKLSADVDFEADGLDITATVEIRFHLGTMIALLVYMGYRGLRLFLAIKPEKTKKAKKSGKAA